MWHTRCRLRAGLGLLLRIHCPIGCTPECRWVCPVTAPQVGFLPDSVGLGVGGQVLGPSAGLNQGVTAAQPSSYPAMPGPFEEMEPGTMLQSIPSIGCLHLFCGLCSFPISRPHWCGSGLETRGQRACGGVSGAHLSMKIFCDIKENSFKEKKSQMLPIPI